MTDCCAAVVSEVGELRAFGVYEFRKMMLNEFSVILKRKRVVYGSLFCGLFERHVCIFNRVSIEITEKFSQYA